MRTNIELNDQLVAQAMQLTGAKTKREVVERGLHSLIANKQRPSLASIVGKNWIADDYDYKALREGKRAEQV